MGAGILGASRVFENGKFESRILFWAHKRWSVSATGTRLLLDGHSGRSEITYFTDSPPKSLAFPGISGAPLFVLRDTVDWVGVVRSGCGDPPNVYSIQATPSDFIDPDGKIRKPRL